MSEIQQIVEIESTNDQANGEYRQLPTRTGTEYTVRNSNRQTRAELIQEVEYMRRERPELMQGNLQLLERDNGRLHRSTGSSGVPEVQPNFNVRLVSDLLSDFYKLGTAITEADIRIPIGRKYVEKFDSNACEGKSSAFIPLPV